MSSRAFSILGIETSCDDTGVAVVSSNGEILGESLASQHALTAQYGGVHPKMAAEHHASVVDHVLQEALHNARLGVEDVDAIAVTCGPGLAFCLNVGVSLAKSLAIRYQKPLVAVNHLEAHILLARMTNAEQVKFPFLVLLVSGGHCLLAVAESVSSFRIIGSTIDDSLGEAYDKVARLLHLDIGAGGGRALESIAQSGNPKAFRFPIPLQRRSIHKQQQQQQQQQQYSHERGFTIPPFDFSYSGLKSSVLRQVRAIELKQRSSDGDSNNVTDYSLATKSGIDWNKLIKAQPNVATANFTGQLQNFTADIAASFQHAALTHLTDKTSRAMKWCQQEYNGSIRDLVVCGGVAANQQLRAMLTSATTELEWNLIAPPARLCTDNGVMIAWAGVEKYRLGRVLSSPELLDYYPRLPVGSAITGDTSATEKLSAQNTC